MFFAVVIGAVAGILGFIPLALALKASKNVTDTSNFSYVSILLLCVIASIAILGVSVALCIVFTRDLVLPFAIAEAVMLAVSAMAFGIYTFVRK